MGNFNILNNSPTIVYPLGGEVIVSDNLLIRWEEPKNIPLDLKIWYEVYIVEYYKNDGRSNYIRIGLMPRGHNSLNYKINKRIRGKRCRVALRAVNQNGEKGKMIHSYYFSILNARLSLPSLLSPLSGGHYSYFIPFIFDNGVFENKISNRFHYRIFYRSEYNNIEWKILADNIKISTNIFNIDVSNFDMASDYEFKIEVTDGENSSSPVFINNISINNLNYFLIDTVPPVGRIQIKDNVEYTRDRDIIVNIDAYDKTTGVKNFNIKQINANDGSVVSGNNLDFTDISSWRIRGNDGFKIITSDFEDFAGNKIEESGNNFRTYKKMDENKITAFTKNKKSGDIWFSFFSEEEDTSYLYRNQRLFTIEEGEITFLKFYNDSLYVAVKGEDNKGILKISLGMSLSTVQDNINEYLDPNEEILNHLYVSDSVINVMEVFDGRLFLGMKNGSLLSFDGSFLNIENEEFLNKKEINFLYSDGNILYIYLRKSEYLITMYKDNEGNYIFNNIKNE